VFALIVTASGFFYVTKVLDLDDEDIGRWELMQEGWQSVVWFLLLWIVTYNLFEQ
jgi:hypothetical protein